MLSSTLVLALALVAPPHPEAQADGLTPEAKVVEYLKANVRPGVPVVVSTLLNEVFTGEPERKALNRLFNTFFKIPLFLVQVQQATGKPPALREIAEQFAFTTPGTADVILRIMESDPRMPRFLERDPQSGEILAIDVELITSHPHFGQILERTIAGFEGQPAPEFAVEAYDGSELNLAGMAGRAFLLYFWFTNCPPCIATTPMLVDLDRVYGPKGFTIIGLNADRVLELDYTDEQRAGYARKLGIGFALAHSNAEVQTAYGGVSLFPTTFFVSKAGVVVKQLVNRQDRAALEDAIERALK